MNGSLPTSRPRAILEIAVVELLRQRAGSPAFIRQFRFPGAIVSSGGSTTANIVAVGVMMTVSEAVNLLIDKGMLCQGKYPLVGTAAGCWTDEQRRRLSCSPAILIDLGYKEAGSTLASPS